MQIYGPKGLDDVARDDMRRGEATMCTSNVRTEGDSNRKTRESNSGEPSGISSTIATKREENGVLCDNVQCNKTGVDTGRNRYIAMQSENEETIQRGLVRPHMSLHAHRRTGHPANAFEHLRGSTEDGPGDSHERTPTRRCG